MRQLLLLGMAGIGVALALHRIVRTGAYQHFRPRAPSAEGTAGLRLPHAVRTDEDVLGVLRRIEQHHVRCADLACLRARTPATRRLARQLSDTHGRALAATDALREQLGMHDDSHRAATRIERLCLQRFAALEAASATGFESAYLAAVVDEHESLLELIDARLLGASRDARVLARVEAARRELQTCGARARRVSEQIRGADPVRTRPRKKRPASS